VVLERIEAFCFRNLADLRLDLHPRFNLIQGDNAQGKTNLLEAVALLSCLRSFRARRVEELVRFGAERARLKGVVEDGGERTELEVELRAGGRRALVGGKPTRDGAVYLRCFPTVLFWPEELAVPRGSPAERRRLLDRAVTTVWPGYVTVARSYQRALLSRNRLLRDGLGARGAAALLEVYESQLAELGGKLVAARVRFLRGFEPTFARVFVEISRSGAVGALRYHTRPELEEAGDRVADLGETLGKLYRETRGSDLARKATSIGPHADDLDFLIDDRSTRSFGSQGQLRSLVLAFKIAQILDGFEKLGRYPVLLLDDVSSELDPKRNRYLFEFIEKIEAQTLLTTTLGESLPVPEKRQNFQVVNGEIRPLGEA
jgi:DNA replication and repair protein RecF